MDEKNLAFPNFPPILQNGYTPYSTLSSNQAPVIEIGVPPSIKPSRGSTLLTIGYL